MNNEITYEELHNKFFYDYINGLLIDKKTHMPVGSLTRQGYLRTQINNKTYAIHRIIYCMNHGYFPENEIDHVNRIKADNRIENLREVSHSCNLRNSKTPNSNKTGIKGVHWVKCDQIWRSTIGINSKTIFVGNFNFFVNAVKARIYAEKIFNFYSCSSESSAVKGLKKIEPLDNEEEKLACSEWEFFMLVRKRRIDKLAETYKKF